MKDGGALRSGGDKSFRMVPSAAFTRDRHFRRIAAKSFRIETVSRSAREVVTDRGINLPIVYWWDGEFETSDPDKAISCVAGTEKFGYVAIDLDDF